MTTNLALQRKTTYLNLIAIKMYILVTYTYKISHIMIMFYFISQKNDDKNLINYTIHFGNIIIIGQVCKGK